MADIQDAYRLIGAELTEFEVRPNDQSLFGLGSSIDYDVTIELVLGKENKLIHYNASVGLRKKGEAETLAKARSVSIFEIKELSKYVEIKEPDQFKVSQDLNLSMGRVAIGLTRGLLIAKFREALIPNVILPLLPFEY